MEIRSIAATLSVAALLVVTAGCHDSHIVLDPPSSVILGDGNVVEQARTVGGFDAVDLRGVGLLYIEQGAREELVIRAEANLLEYLLTEVRGGELAISKRAVTLLNNAPIEYHLTVVDLEQVLLTGVGSIELHGMESRRLVVQLTGVGNISIANLDATSLDIAITGVGDVTASGVVQQQVIALGGVGSYFASELGSNTAEALISALGSVTVCVSDTLTATITGSGNLYYIGDPLVQSSISGTGRVVRIGG